MARTLSLCLLVFAPCAVYVPTACGLPVWLGLPLAGALFTAALRRCARRGYC